MPPRRNRPFAPPQAAPPKTRLILRFSFSICPRFSYLRPIMSEFIVSARKYRPATFRSVVGQSHITSTLQNAIERGQLAHAYLFCGPRGVGKTTCARIFAKAINCLAPRGAEACNECESCRSFNEGRSLNIHELDAASNNSVEDIRSLIEQVRIVPQVGRYSVFIIDEVHMLSAAAFNAFLKTLEEPPAHAVFILATTEKHKIIPTILSRCQIYDFNRIRVEDAVGYLRHIAEQEGVAADEESLNLIAQKADGGMRDALSMFDKAVSFCGGELDYRSVARTLNVLDYDTYFGITDLLLAGNYVEALVAFDEVLSKGFSGQTFMAGLNRHMRDLMMARSEATLRLIEMTGTLLERYRAQAGACTVEFLFGAIALLTEFDGKIRQSSNQRLLVELGLMKIAGLGQKKNEGLTDPADYPLPEIGAPRAATPAAQATAAVAPTTAAPAPTATPAAPASPTPTAPAATPGSAPAPEAPAGTVPPPRPAAPQTSAPQPAPQPQPTPQSAAQPARRPLMGTSLSELLAAAQPADAAEAGAAAAPVAAPQYDPECAAKLDRARGAILRLMQERRPRFVAAFEQMTLDDHAIRLRVPTPELREEMLRSKTAMLLRIAELAGVTGMIDLEIAVDETVRAARPIRLEDRVKHLTDKNPLLTELRRALDLEVE